MSHPEIILRTARRAGPAGARGPDARRKAARPHAAARRARGGGRRGFCRDFRPGAGLARLLGLAAHGALRRQGGVLLAVRPRAVRGRVPPARTAWAVIGVTVVYGPWQQLVFNPLARQGARDAGERLAAAGFELWVLALVLLTLSEAWRGLAVDLVERRRRLRILFVAASRPSSRPPSSCRPTTLCRRPRRRPLVTANLALITTAALAAIWNLVQLRTASWLEPEPAVARSGELTPLEQPVLRVAAGADRRAPCLPRGRTHDRRPGRTTEDARAGVAPRHQPGPRLPQFQRFPARLPDPRGLRAAAPRGGRATAGAIDRARRRLWLDRPLQSRLQGAHGHDADPVPRRGRATNRRG